MDAEAPGAEDRLERAEAALDAAMDRGSIQDEELFLMLSSGPGVAFPGGA